MALVPIDGNRPNRWPLLATVIAYFCGCFNGAVIVSKYILRDDVRNHGSGNAGLTNFYRTFGGPLTFVVILTDVLKAVVAILVGASCSAVLLWTSPGCLTSRFWANTGPALFCLLGHMFPCMFHFKGGKGILSGGTIAHDDGLADRPGGLGRLPDPGHRDQIRVSGIRVGGSQFPLHLLVLLSVFLHRGPGLYHWAGWWSGSTGAISVGCSTETKINSVCIQKREGKT